MTPGVFFWKINESVLSYTGTDNSTAVGHLLAALLETRSCAIKYAQDITRNFILNWIKFLQYQAELVSHRFLDPRCPDSSFHILKEETHPHVYVEKKNQTSSCLG